MTLDTDLSRKPYFDDYDVTKNFYRVLYRPAAAVQTRELNQMQTILQDQIDKFGRHIFKEGSVVEGCAFTFDNSYNFVKIKDNYSNNSAISSLTEFETRYAINDNGLQALVVNTIRGYESQNPDLNTLYIKYLNSGTFANGDVQSQFANGEVIQIRTTANAASVDSILIGNVTVATVANSAGKGYAFTTTEGVIFKKGFFIRVEPQTLVVDKYNNVPDGISVGFEANEEIVTPEIDTSLLDNAAGSPNYDAPGAYRLKLVPTLVTRVSNTVSNTSTFFSLCDFKNGLPVSIKNDPQYAALAKDVARRTYETSGDYVVNPFLLSTDRKYSNNVANSSYLSIVASPGIGYVKGYRVEFINNNTADLRMGTDYVTIDNQIVTANFGYYFNVSEFCGDFNSDNLTRVELHSVAKTAVTGKTFLSTAYSSSTKIGTAYVRGIAYSSGTPGIDAIYRLYIFNISLSTGQKISDVRSLMYYNGSLRAVTDVVLDKDFSGTNIAKIQDSANELMVYPTGQMAIRPAGFSSTAEYIYRNKASANFLQPSGNLSITLPSAVGTGSEQFNYGTGTLSTSLENSFIVIPTADGLTGNKTGTVNTAVSSSNVSVGNVGTSFLSEYNVGDYIYIDNTITRRIIDIANNTHLTVDTAVGQLKTNVTHKKIFPSGVPINFTPSTRTIEITSPTTATIALGDTISADFAASVYFDTSRSATVPIAKTIKKSTLIKIQANTNSGGAAGPWCLGIPDVLKLNAVYVDSTGSGTYSNTNPDKVTSFRLDNGQRDSYYGLAYISSTIPIAPNSTMLVSVDNFVAAPSQGVGFFTAASYPIDDANTANTNAIQTYQIPFYTSTLGKVLDLRDSIDFRPYAVNTAVANATSTAGATVNPSGTLTLYSYGANGAYLPSPDSNYESTIQYYLPRQDRISLTTSGQILVTEGISSLQSSPPPEVPGTMTLGIAKIPPYPSLTPSEGRTYNRYDYAVQTTMFQTKRYTMAEINRLSKRIDKLEYYTSLSLIEQSTASLLVRSDATGQNRFKNGILVDPFKDHTIGNTNESNYNIAIDQRRAEARPFFRQMSVGMRFDAAESTAVKTGDLVTLPYTANNVNQQQLFASKYRNCIEGNIFNYRGRLVLDPPGIIDADLTQAPVINSNIDLYSTWANSGTTSGFGTQWGNWTNIGAETLSSTSSSTSLTGITGTGVQNYLETTTNTLTQQQRRSGTRYFTTESTQTIETGQYVNDVSIKPYVPTKQVYFKAFGMKPNTRLYVYFDNINVSSYVLPLTLASNDVTILMVGGQAISSTTGSYVYTGRDGNRFTHSNNWGGNLYSDASGNVYGIFSIPAGIFTAGDLEFKVTDISNLEQGESAVTTQASATMLCSPLSIQKTRTRIQIRSPQINTEEVTQDQTVQRNTVETNSWTVAPVVNTAVQPVVTDTSNTIVVVVDTSNNSVVTEDTTTTTNQDTVVDYVDWGNGGNSGDGAGGDAGW